MFKAIDLFSGCGGLTEGLKKAGFSVVGAIEIDDLCAESYRINHPEVYLWKKDIRLVAASSVIEKLKLRKGELDILAGCPPCQGFSEMRTLNGKKRIVDKRNNLIEEFTRFIKKIRPKVVMMENVPGLLRNKRFNHFCHALRNMGYSFRDPKVLDAAFYGVPQRRKRLIILAGLDGEISYANPSRTKITVRRRIGDLSSFTPEKHDPLHAYKENRKRKILNLIKRIRRNGGSRRELGKRFQLKCHKKCEGFKDVYGRMKWDDVAPTITGGCINPSKGRFLHPSRNRAITLREAALLQSFRKDYYFSMRKGRFAVAQMIGNALPPEFIRRQSKQIYEYLNSLKGTRRRAYS